MESISRKVIKVGYEEGFAEPASVVVHQGLMSQVEQMAGVRARIHQRCGVRPGAYSLSRPPKKAWFLERLLAKHGDPSWKFEPGYPLIDQIILYEQKIEIRTGKQCSGLSPLNNEMGGHWVVTFVTDGCDTRR